MSTGSGSITVASAKRVLRAMESINTSTGEIHVGIDALTTEKMRECDHEITRLDAQIEDIKEELKQRRDTRAEVVEQLRGYVRGETALPFEEANDV